jgi:outer membrane biosynthesis protein TonB
MQAKLGGAPSLPDLAKALDVSQEAVLVAMNKQSKASHQLPPPEIQTSVSTETVDVQTAVSPEAIDEALALEDADELEDENEVEPEEVEETEPVEPPPEEAVMATKKKKKVPAKKKTKKTAAKKKAPAKKAKAAAAAPSKKKKKAPAKKPAKTPPPVTSEVKDPPKAESAKRATGSAKKKAPVKTAKRAKAPVDPSKRGAGKRTKDGRVDDPWGRHTWEKRYNRERKNKFIKQLRPGMKPTREYKGTKYQVTVLNKYYKFNGKMYPTLYSIVKEITGTREAPRQLDHKGKRPKGSRQLCNWSAPKFFALKVYLSNR